LVHPRPVLALDSHQHIHMIPPLLLIALKLAVEERISEIRVSRERFSIAQFPDDLLRARYCLNIVKYLVLNFLSRPAFRRINEWKLSAPHSVLGILYSGEMSCRNIEQGLKAAFRRKMKSIEVIVHVGKVEQTEVVPGWAGVEDAFYTSENRERERQELLRFASRRTQFLAHLANDHA
jgi:predicted glycoside hydrolase/deacetylase ChbG (UPF0249 family)